jgi:hypothetical protein
MRSLPVVTCFAVASLALAILPAVFFGIHNLRPWIPVGAAAIALIPPRRPWQYCLSAALLCVFPVLGAAATGIGIFYAPAAAFMIAAAAGAAWSAVERK